MIHRTTRRLVGPETVFRRQVAGSKSDLKAVVMKPVAISFFPSEEPRCKAALHWAVLEAPVAKGQKVGEIHVLDEQGALLQKGDLVALEEVKGSFFFLLKKKIFRF